MTATVHGTLSGTVCLPASKSIAHRLLICAALSNRPSTILCHSTNSDIEATVECLNELGAQISYNNEAFSVIPMKRVTKGRVLNCWESGSTLRFLLPIAAALEANATFTGQGRLPMRPLTPLCEEMAAHGIKLSDSGNLPLSCHGRLPSGIYTIAGGVSSQFISGLLMALPLTGGASSVNVIGTLQSLPYIELTINAMRLFGVNVEVTSQGFAIPEGQRYFGLDKRYTVESDWSAAAFWIVAGVAGKHPITCTGIDYVDSLQGDKRIVEILRNSGATITIGTNHITSYPSQLHGSTIDCQQIPDLVPALAVAAATAIGTTVFNNVERLRIKESDRVESIVRLLTAVGIETTVACDRLIVYGGKPHNAKYNPCNDHRMAMAATILAVTGDCTIEIEDIECTAKSYPHFITHFKALGGITE